MILKPIFDTEEALFLIKMADTMRASGSMINGTAKDSKGSQMGTSIKERMTREKCMAKAAMNGQMATFTMANG